MTLRGNAGRLVQGVNNLSGFVSLTEGPGIEIIPNNARNSLQFGTVTAMLEFDDILANGDSTARSAKFLNNASDTIPALIVHNTLDFGNGAVAPGVTLKYSPGTPDGLVIGPTTGTDKKILRIDLLGANTSTAIVAKSGMTFDTGLTLTVDNLVAKSVTNNGDITAHRLLPYDANGLTINLDTCTMTCADTVTDPRVNIYPGLNCFGAITGSAGMTLTGELSLNSTIITPSLIVPIDLTLKPSGDVRVFSGKTLFCDTLSQSDTNSNFNITAIGTNKNIRITPSGTARTYFGGSGIMIGYISNYYASDITIQPDNAKIILAAPVIASNITATNIITAANTNLNISPGTNGITDISSAVAIRDTLTVNTITSRTTNLALSATGTGTINLNSAVVGTHITTNILTSPATVNLTINSPAGTINTNATNITASGALSLASNGALNLQALTGNSSVNISGTGTGVINMLSTLLVNTIIPYNSSNLSLAASGTNGNVSLTATGTGTINLNSPTVGTTITATTFTAPPSTNLNINALGGSIITNAIRLAPTTSLTIAPATSLTFTPGSPAQFNCSVNVANDLTVTGSLNGTGLTNTITNGNLTLTPNGTGLVRIASGKTLATDAISSNAAVIAIKNNMTFDATKTLTVDNIISKSITNNGNIVASKLIKNIGDGLTIDLDNSTITCTDTTLPILIEPHVQVNGILTCTSNAIIYNGLATTTLTPYNSTGLTINLNNSTLSSAVPINISSIVANTISSAAATNLTINTPGGTINTNATNITASGALSLTSNGALNLQALTGNSSVNISGTGTGTINLNSPTVGTTITATTFTAPPLSNLNINAAGGSILSNALNWSATGALGINSGGTMTLWPTNNQCIIDATLTVNRSIIGSRFAGTEFVSNVLNTGISLSPNGTGQVNVLAGKTLTADTISSTTANTNLILTPNGTGYVSIPNTGLRLPNGSSTLNWYEEATLSSAWVNVVTDTPTNTTTLYVVRIGKQVFITLVSNNPIMPTTDIGVPTMQTNLVSKYSPVATFTQFNGSSYSIQISTAGVITLGNFVNSVAITPIMNFSYFTNN